MILGFRSLLRCTLKVVVLQSLHGIIFVLCYCVVADGYDGLKHASSRLLFNFSAISRRQDARQPARGCQDYGFRV